MPAARHETRLPTLDEQNLAGVVHTLARHLRRRYGQAVHKLALNAGLSCPNRDGSRDIGGCTFCNTRSFSPPGVHGDIDRQVDAARAAVGDKTGALLYLAYFQAYTNTHAEVGLLDELYSRATSRHDVIGLAVGTRPDCVPASVLDLLCRYQDSGQEVWLELGLQSSFDETLARVRRGHGFAEYAEAVQAARRRGLKVCTHLIVGLPGETPDHALTTLRRVVDLGVDGLKLHPLHVVRGTQLARQWRRGDYQPWTLTDYVQTAVDMIRHTPAEVVYHRVSASARPNDLLAPDWCSGRWKAVNAITTELYRLGGQASALGARPAPAIIESTPLTATGVTTVCI